MVRRLFLGLLVHAAVHGGVAFLPLRHAAVAIGCGAAAPRPHTTPFASRHRGRCVLDSAARSAAGSSSTWVFVRDVPTGTSETNLREAMGTFGEVLNVSLPTDPQGPLIKSPLHFGFAKVSFRHEGDAARALAADDAPLVLGRRVTLEGDLTDATGREALLQQLKQCRGRSQVETVAQRLGQPRSKREANKLIIAWGHAKEWRRALRLLETMRDVDGVAPDCKTFSAAISACEKSGQWERDHMITTTEALADAVQAAQSAGAVGIDTEFVWDRTYYPTLGLVQIGYPDGHCELIDAPAIEDWSPFATLMADPNTVKILHDAQQDLTILKRACGAYP